MTRRSNAIDKFDRGNVHTVVVSPAEVLVVFAAVVQRGITAPRDAIVRREFAGPLRLEEQQRELQDLGIIASIPGRLSHVVRRNRFRLACHQDNRCYQRDLSMKRARYGFMFAQERGSQGNV